MPGTSYNVLVVDDSSTNRAYLHYILDEDGYMVTEAPSGEACLDMLASAHPALILLDVVMGGMDGFQTLERIQQHPAVADIPVIMLTSLEDQRSKLRAFELGAVDYIVKSANPAEIKARVRVHVRLNMANKEMLAQRAKSIQSISSAQQALLARPQDVPGAKFTTYYKSLHEAGGDFIDVVMVAEDVYFYLIVDVAGHDVGTSLITPAVKVLFKQFATPAYSVAETLSYMNGVLAQTVCQDNYLTAFALRLNRRNRKAVFLSAGHPPALYIPADGRTPSFIGKPNPIIGMMEGVTFKAEEMDIFEGDRFLLYTDGLVENSKRTDQAWTTAKDQLPEAASKRRDLTLTDLPRILAEDLAATESVDDDVALMAIEV